MKPRREMRFLAMILLCLFVFVSTLPVFAADDSAAELEARRTEENQDGDRDYISNDGTLITIPTVDPSKEEIYDYAGLFTDEEKKSLNERRLKIETAKRCDIVILTLTEAEIPYDFYDGSDTTKAYAEQFYMDNHFADDAVVFTIDMNNRVLWTTGHGKYDDPDFVDLTETIYKQTMARAKKADYFGAANVFMDQFDSYKNIAHAMLPTGISLLISLALMVITIVVMLTNHNATQPSKVNIPAVKVFDYKVVRHQVHYLGTRRSVRHIPKARSGSSGGGGFSGGHSSGGGFSGGGGGFSGGGGKF